MFYDCNNLKDINELRYLYVKQVKDFSRMFNWCSSLSDIKPLQNWNVSNGNNFECMFLGCSSLSDIKPFTKLECFKLIIFHICLVDAHHYQILNLYKI